MVSIYCISLMAIYPICSMYGIFTYIWMIFRANVVKSSIHGAYGYIYVESHSRGGKPG